MNYFLIFYTIMVFAIFVDILISIKLLRQIKSFVPMKQRGDVINNIEYLDGLKKYCIIWPYIIYKLNQTNEK